MSRADAFRYRITFAKSDAMRYTSHLDLQRTWERLIRRADLPLLFSEGFHTRPRFSVASALPLGFTGGAEIAELYLEDHFDPNALVDTLHGFEPPGLDVLAAEEIPHAMPAVQTLLVEAEYRVDVEDVPRDDAAERVTALLARGSIEVERRGKTFDLRPRILDLQVDDGGNAASDGVAKAVRLRMRLEAKEGATGRPDDVLRAMELDPERARIHRMRLILCEPDDVAGTGAGPTPSA